MPNDRAECRTPVPEGRYANVLRIGFNAQEFLLDFGQLEHGGGNDTGERYHTRIIVVPVNTRRFLALLQQSVESYEETFAVIPDPNV